MIQGFYVVRPNGRYHPGVTKQRKLRAKAKRVASQQTGERAAALTNLAGNLAYRERRDKHWPRDPEFHYRRKPNPHARLKTEVRIVK